MKKRRLKRAKPKLLSGAKLTKALDDAVRDYLHSKYPSPQCFVCHIHSGWFHPKDNPKGCQVGHYISRKVYPLRWSLKNVFPQCSACNYTHQFNTLPFTSRIIHEIGKGRILYLEDIVKSRNGRSMSTIEKRNILVSLKEMIHEIS